MRSILLAISSIAFLPPSKSLPACVSTPFTCILHPILPFLPTHKLLSTNPVSILKAQRPPFASLNITSAPVESLCPISSSPENTIFIGLSLYPILFNALITYKEIIIPPFISKTPGPYAFPSIILNGFSPNVPVSKTVSM